MTDLDSKSTGLVECTLYLQAV